MDFKNVWELMQHDKRFKVVMRFLLQIDFDAAKPQIIAKRARDCRQARRLPPWARSTIPPSLAGSSVSLQAIWD